MSQSIINKNLTQEQTHTYLHTSLISHRGTPISFAMRDDGHIFYSVLDMSNTQPNAGKSDNDKDYWSKVDLQNNTSSLKFPGEISQVGYRVVPNFPIDKYDSDNEKIIQRYLDKNDKELSRKDIKNNNEIKCLGKNNIKLSRKDIKNKTDSFHSSTARFGATAPFQTLSDGKYVYVFRQSIAGDDPKNERSNPDNKDSYIVNNTLLVDRFILSGTVLKLSREIRYQRSCHKTEPESRKDTLSATDVEGNPFYEPTRELAFANNLSKGNFSVLLLPGANSEEQRWQIFTTDAVSNKVNSFNIKFDYSIVFDTSDSQGLIDEFIKKYEFEEEFIAIIQKKITENKTDSQIVGDFLYSHPFTTFEDGKKLIAKDALGEIVYTVRTGVAKDDFIPASVSEWPLIEYDSDGTSIKGDYLSDRGVLKPEYSFQASKNNELQPSSANYTPGNGLSSCYYYQQEMGTDNKPMKNKACVMLAMGLNDKNENKYIGILNFSVADSGRLSRLTTDTVNMPDINVQALDENPYETLDEIPTDDANKVAWQKPQKMSLLDIDPNGLSTSGGVLKFAYTNADIGSSEGYSNAVLATNPYLFDDSLGRVNLYLKGLKDNFFVLYFNPTGSKKITVTKSGPQSGEGPSPLSLKPRLDKDMNISVAANLTDAVNTCILSMTSQKGEVEKWSHLPKRFSQIAGILNGNGQLPLGTLEPHGDTDDSRAAYIKPATGNGTLNIRTTVDNNLMFQDTDGYATDLADGAKYTVILSELSSYLANNTELNIAKKTFSLEDNPVTVKADVFYKSYLSGMVDEIGDIDKLWGYLKSLALIQEVSRKPDQGNLGTDFVEGTSTSLNDALTTSGIDALSLELLKEGNEADKKARLAGLKQTLIALILDVAKIRLLSFTVQDTNTQNVDRLEAGLEVTVLYNYENNFICKPANLKETSASAWEHARSYLFNAGLEYDEATDATTEITAACNYTYTINNTIGQWEDWEASLALEFTPASATDGALLSTDTKLEALQPTEKGLSVEAWVKPSAKLINPGSILYYKKDERHYSLSIEKDSADASKYKYIATLGDKKYTSKKSFPFNNSAEKEHWRHLAFTHKKYWGYQLERTNTINCGNDSSLHLDDEFTLEVLVKIGSAGTLLEKKDEYCLSINGSNEVVFNWGSGNTNYLKGSAPIATDNFYKITLIRSRNPPQTNPTKAEYPITGGDQKVCTLNGQYNRKSTVTQVKVKGLPNGKKFKKGNVFRVRPSTSHQGDSNIELTSDITGNDKVQTMNVKPVYLWGNLGDPVEDKNKWYANTTDTTELLKGMAEKQDQSEDSMKLSQTNMFGTPEDPSSEDPSSEYNPTYYHTLIVTASEGHSTEWTSTIPQEIERVEAYKNFIMGGGEFKGTFASVRIWNRALSIPEAKALSVSENKTGLLSHWSIAEGKGKYLYDDVSENHGLTQGDTWTDSPQSNQPGQFHFYVDGSPESHDTLTSHTAQGVDQLSIGGYKTNSGTVAHFKGTLEEVRIWNVLRTNEQITDNAFGRLKGEREQLLAHYTFDKLITQTDEVKDAGVNIVNLTVEKKNNKQLTEVLSTAPIATEIPQVRSALTGVLTEYNGTIYSRPAVVEYGDVQKNDDGTLNGILKRCYSFIDGSGAWNRMTGYKVGNLISQWYGQAQFAPQVMGYLEGPPPLPAENFPIGSDADVNTYAYKLNNSISFNQAEEVSYNYNTSKEAGWNVAMESESSIGASGPETTTVIAPLGLGVTVKLPSFSIKAKGKSNWETSGNRSQSYERGTSVNTDRSFSASQAGYDNGKSGDERYYKMGNTGYALVKSKTADIYLLRLAHNNALVNISWQPNPDIPEDVNIIPFPINPLYTKQGTLDGKSGETTDDHYPQAQGAYGQYSYFKPREAYKLKKQIERERMKLKAYFEDSFDVARTNGHFQAAAAATGVAQLAGALPGGALITSGINQIGGQLATQLGYNNTELKDDLAKIGSQRNLVNTYVWTVEGGFYAESTEVAQTQQETYANETSLSLGGAYGAAYNAEIMVFHIENNTFLSSGSSFSLTKSKTKESSTSFGLDVSVGMPTSPRYKYAGVDGRTLTNELIKPGTVDAYRFMSFYLEPKEKNFVDLFTKVIDPIWLDESPDPNAQALRQARGNEDKAKPCWRIMHRVTYVSRILPEFQPESPPSLEKSMRAAGIESNYMLIKKFEPYVSNISDSGDFFNKIEEVITGQLPEFVGYKREIKKYLALYFNIDQA